MLLVAIAAVLIGLLVILWLLRYTTGLLGGALANDMSRIPSPRKAPMTGHLQDLLEGSYHKLLTTWASELGNIYKLNVLGIEGLVVCDPITIGQILGQERGITGLPKLAAYHQLDMVRLYGVGMALSVY